jgi:NAD(P)-dependent dehydrogenase (short-subunit alcohol dehydrogenase family)
MACPFALTPEGFESQLAADHLGHFVLTNRLLPKLLNGTEPVRIVNVSSCGNRAGPIRWTDPNFSQPDSYEPWEAYGQAKTSNVLFTVALNKKLARKYPDRDIRSYALHPGYISTNLQKHSYLPGWAETSVQKMFKGEPSPITKQKSLQQGCATALRAALDPGLSKEEGVWLVDCELSTDPTWIEPYALDEADAERHWGWSEELVGEKFEI